MSKVLHNKDDILGMAYLIDYLKNEYFPSVSVLEKQHYEQIVSRLEIDCNITLSKSTIIRICNFLRKPTPLSYKSLDDFVYWCFDKNIHSFKQLLKEHNTEIASSHLISEEEVASILKQLNVSKSKSLTERPLTIELASTPFQLSLTEGNVAQLLTSIAHCTGDILSEKFLNDPELLKSIIPDNRIANRVFVNEKRRQNNIEHIVKKAIEFCRTQEYSSHNEVDPDWVSDFFETAKDTSNENMQYIWAKILANEVDQPGSFSRRAIHTVKLISPDEASVFNLFCNCLCEIYPNETRTEHILVRIPEDVNLNEGIIGFDDTSINILVDLGLVYESKLVLYAGEKCTLKYFDEIHIIKPKQNNQNLDIVRLTNTGMELFKVIQKVECYEYFVLITNFTDN